MTNLPFFLAKFIATFGFTGFFPKAPGTAGTLAATLLIYPFIPYLSMGEMQHILSSTFLLGVIATSFYIKKTQRLDPPEVVIDEAFGVFTSLFINIYFAPQISLYYIAGSTFILFRFFDILKPFPISLIDQRMKNALGVMLDDFVAGVFASAVFIIFIKIFL